jgi:DNA-binding response OmpR family regulator
MSAISPGRVLVIDDSDLMLERIGLTLTSAGFDVVVTNQTVGAARHLRSRELVLVDYHMPGLDGGDVLKSLRSAAEGFPGARMFVLYTSDEAAGQRHRELGFDAVLTKKGHMGELVRQLGALLRLVRIRAFTARK